MREVDQTTMLTILPGTTMTFFGVCAADELGDLRLGQRDALDLLARRRHRDVDRAAQLAVDLHRERHRSFASAAASARGQA